MIEPLEIIVALDQGQGVKTQEKQEKYKGNLGLSCSCILEFYYRETEMICIPDME